jgi:TetR/AcrR family transcriptional repressor of nem operon
MRRSRQEAAETRQHIVETAATEFRSNGIDGTGLAGLMAAAGLTHGGFYKHFESKEQVVEEALTFASESLFEIAKGATVTARGNRGLQALLAQYLSVEHRDNAAHGCPYSALGCEVARSSDSVREGMTAGFLKMIDLIAGQLEGLSPAAAKKEALWIFSAMIGALSMARMVNDPNLSASILRETCKHLNLPS